jgi:ribosomal protein S18 acetylase RimI-like enzyme
MDRLTRGATIAVTGATQIMDRRQLRPSPWTIPNGSSAADEGTIGDMQIDVARRTDVDRIVELVNDAYRGTSRAPGWTHETHLFTGARIDAAAVAGMIQPDRSTVLVMREDAAIIACVALQRLNDREWYLSMLAVDPGRQTYGAGKSIMAGAEKFAQERGAERMKISVINLRDSLIAWYERQGYVRTGVVEAFRDDPAVGRPLREDLALVALTKPLA